MVWLKRTQFILLGVALALCVSCASGPRYDGTHDPEWDRNSKAHPAAFTVDGYYYNKQEQPRRDPTTTHPFYYKDCRASGRNHFSKVEYVCDWLSF